MKGCSGTSKDHGRGVLNRSQKYAGAFRYFVLKKTAIWVSWSGQMQQPLKRHPLLWRIK
jgi:hypothetical protein